MPHHLHATAPRLHAALLAAALAGSQPALAGSVSSRAQDPQLALAESGALAMAQRMQSQHGAQAPDAAASASGSDAASALNPYAVVTQTSQEAKLKKGAAAALKSGSNSPQAECQVNFVPLPTAAYNRGLYGAPASSSPTYVVAKGPVVVKC